MRAEIINESKAIKKLLDKKFEKLWDGKRSIKRLQDADYNWRQMEWIGWYLEFRGREILIDSLGGDVGPTFGKTTLDYKRNFVWDFKSHAINSSAHPWAIMNDCEAIEKCIKENNGIGFIIATGHAEYNDENRSFQIWHKELKGELSSYEKERIKRKAHSRLRKTSFELMEFKLIYLDSIDDLKKGINDGWIKYFQKNMRNSNGRPRRSKYMFNMEKLPECFIL